jgi:hypothetical protein
MQFSAVQTAVDSLVFGFQKILTAFKLMWLPLAILLAILVGAVAMMGRGIVIEDSYAVVAGISAIYGIMLLGMIALVPAVVMLTRIAAGEPAPSGIAYFKFGAREWRYIAANIIMGILASLIIVIAIIPFIVVFAGSALMAVPAEVWSDPEALEYTIEEIFENGDFNATTILLAVLAGLLGALFSIWFIVRSITFVPMAAIENRLDFGAAFSETKGNFWKLFFGSLLLNIMQMIVYYAFMLIVMVPMMFMGISFFAGMDSDMMDQIDFSDFSSSMVIGGVVLGLAYLALVIFYTASSLAFPAKAHVALSQGSAED